MPNGAGRERRTASNGGTDQGIKEAGRPGAVPNNPGSWRRPPNAASSPPCPLSSVVQLLWGRRDEPVPRATKRFDSTPNCPVTSYKHSALADTPFDEQSFSGIQQP